MAMSACRRDCQIVRQISSDLMVLNTVSTMALSKQLPLPLMEGIRPVKTAPSRLLAPFDAASLGDGASIVFCTDAKGEAMGQVHVLTGPVRRRVWLPEEKAALVGAAFAPGAVVAEVARRADVNASLLYRWRRELSVGSGGFAEVVVAPLSGGSVVEPVCGAAIEVRLADGAQLRIPTGAAPELAAAVIRAVTGR